MVANARTWGRRGAALVVLLLACTMVASSVVGDAAGAARDRHKRGGVHTQVVGGDAVPNDKYPFMSFLLIRRDRNTFLCGGTLISPRHVLTAAHCVTPKPKGVRVIVGRTLLTETEQGQTARAAKITVHPKWRDTPTFRYDAAVLTLDREITEIDPISLVDVGDGSFEDGTDALRIAGWGSINRVQVGGPTWPAALPDRMQEAVVPVVGDGDCQETYAATGARNLRVDPALMICAGAEELDSCQGDSGGPLFAADETSANGYRQVGIVSFGLGCGDEPFAGVYTQLSAPEIGNFIRGVVPPQP